MGIQVKQVYYLPYACMEETDLQDWRVTYHVSPRNYIPPAEISDDSSTQNMLAQEESFYQEDGLPGTFVIDLGDDLDNINPIDSDEITDPTDLAFLAKLNTEAGPEDMGNEEIDEDEEDDQNILPEYAPNDPDDC